MKRSKVGRRRKSEKGKEDDGEEDPEGDCSGSARGGRERNRRGIVDLSMGSREEAEEGVEGNRKPQRMHHRRFPSDQEGPLGDQHRPTEQALGHRN